MGRLISCLDIFSLIIILITFLIFALRRENALYKSVKFFFGGLLVLFSLYNLCNIFEWTGLSSVADIYGDYLGILLPMSWAFLFYALLQQLTEQELKNRDVRFQELFDEAPIGYHEIDTKGRIVRVNKTELQMLGYTLDEMKGHYVWDFTKEPEISQNAVLEKIEGKSLSENSFERSYRCKDGKIIPVLIKDKFLTNDDEEIIGIRSTIQNIFSYKNVMEGLKESEEFNRALFEYNPIETIVVNTKGEIINFNLPKRTSGDRLPNVRDIMYKDYAKKHKSDMYSELMQCISSGKSKTFPEEEYGNKFLYITIAPFPKGAIITSQDITDRKRSEEEIKKLSSAVEQSNDGIAIGTMEEKFSYVNNAFARMHGYSPEEMIGKKILDANDNKQQDEFQKRLKQIKTKGEWVGEISHRKKDGTTFPTQMSIVLLKDEKGKATGLLAICRDISERKFIEEALRSSEERYRELWDNAPVAYHTLNTKGIITSVNHTEAKMLEYSPEEMLGRAIFDFILPEQQEEAKKRFLQKIQGQQIPKAKDRIYVTKTGKKIHVTIDDVWEYDENKKIIGVRTTMMDITDRKKAEEEREESFKQLQKNFEEIITALVSAVEKRDLYTAGHQKRVTELACAIAKEMNLTNNQIASIRMAGLVHDIGKISIPTEILSKPAKLTETEMDLVKTHAKVGYDILKTVEFPWPVAKIVLQHHERINGSGYPNGIKGDKILLEARILSVADVVEAIATYRPYHKAFGIDTALEEISKNSGTLYDPNVVDACIKLFKEKQFTFKIQPEKQK